MARVVLNGPYNNAGRVVQLYQGANTSILQKHLRKKVFAPQDNHTTLLVFLYGPFASILVTQNPLNRPSQITPQIIAISQIPSSTKAGSTFVAKFA